MMERALDAILKAIILGLVQGLTELLPVSSKSHLIFARDLLSMSDPGLLQAVTLHVATAAATVAVFWRDILELFRGFGRGAAFTVRRGSVIEAIAREPLFRLSLLYVAAIIPAGLAGVLLKKPIERLFEETALAGALLGVTGSILWLTRCKRDPENGKPSTLPAGKPVGLGSAIVMGIAQAFALLPGISRSGATISSGILSGVKASEAARFSFIMSVPVILGAAFFSALWPAESAVRTSLVEALEYE
jgi:undecaprenyl-diphosphatase